MAKKSNNNEPDNSNNGDLAGDDYGVRNDQILDLCDFIVRKVWEKVYVSDQESSKNKQQKQDLSLDELHKIAITLDTVWILTQNVLGIDEKLKWIIEENNSIAEEDDEEDEEDGLDADEEN